MTSPPPSPADTLVCILPTLSHGGKIESCLGVDSKPSPIDIEKYEGHFPLAGCQPHQFGKEELPEEELPEGGRGWLVVLGCLIVAALMMGWPLSWSIFQSHYKATILSGTSDTLLSLLGTTQNLTMTFVCFVSGKLGDRFGYKRFIFFGSLCSVAGLLGAAFSTRLWHLFLTQGVLPGIGVGLVFPMVVSYPSQWFKRKRALATGIVVAGSSFGGGASCLILRAMLDHLSIRHTLFIYAGINSILLSAAFFMIKSRGTKKHIKIVWVDKSLFHDPKFWSVAFAMFFCTFGYIPSVIFLTSFTTEKVPGITSQLSVTPISIMNFSMAVGRTVIGLFGDRIGVVNAFIVSALLSGLSQLLVWNFASSFTAIIIFAVIQGAFGGCFVSLIAPVSAQLFGIEKLATLSGLLILFNGPGNLAGAPLFGALLDATGRNWHAGISVSGGFTLLGGAAMLYARFKGRSDIFSIY